MTQQIKAMHAFSSAISYCVFINIYSYIHKYKHSEQYHSYLFMWKTSLRLSLYALKSGTDVNWITSTPQLHHFYTIVTDYSKVIVNIFTLVIQVTTVGIFILSISNDHVSFSPSTISFLAASSISALSSYAVCVIPSFVWGSQQPSSPQQLQYVVQERYLYGSHTLQWCTSLT